MLKAVYDLSTNPPTYDVITHLGFVERERIRRGEKDVHLHILPGPKRGFRQDGLWPQSVEERRQLLERVVKPTCWLLPSIRSTVVEPSRTGFENTFGYKERHISLPKMVELMREGIRPLRSLAQRMTHTYDSKLITFTLREAEHWPQRNSNFFAWMEAAVLLQAQGYRVTIIRDTLKADTPIPGLRVSPTAAKDLLARADLYSVAAVNVGINNGPIWLSMFMDLPTIMMRPTTDIEGCYNDKFFAHCGIPRGSQLPGVSPYHQRLVWEEDTTSAIVQAVEDFLA